MKIHEVSSKKLEKVFLEVHCSMNRTNPHWIRPIDNDVISVFDASKNKAFRHGAAVRWILYDENEVPIGRIAAFINSSYKNKGDLAKIGSFGFFECIDDQKAANILFDTAKEWLASKGCAMMDGPINFGERDKFWGLLTEGFHEPMYGMNYNPPYYSKLFENFGFHIYYNQICFKLEIGKQLKDKFYQAHSEFQKKQGFSVKHLNVNELDKIASDFCTVYNKAWARHEGNKQMSVSAAKILMKSMKPVMDPLLVWFVYYDKEPVAMWINIPDINEIFKNFNGKLGILEKVRFLWHNRKRKYKRIVGLIYGVIPEFQGTGVDYYMIVEAQKAIIERTNYKEIELLWIGDFNPKMINIAKNLGAEKSRNLITYRYIIDQSLNFQRHPMLS